MGKVTGILTLEVLPRVLTKCTVRLREITGPGLSLTSRTVLCCGEGGTHVEGGEARTAGHVRIEVCHNFII